MANDHLYVANWRRRYELLNTKALDHRTNLLKIEREQSKALAATLTVLRDMHRHLKAKPICDDTADYPSVQVWVEDWAKPFLHLEARQVFHLISVGEHLLGKVTTEELDKMGIENAKTLSEVARSRGKVSKELVEKALTVTNKELKADVREALYGKNDAHPEGKWVDLVVRGPQEYIDDIKEFIKITRRQQGNGPSDAELIALVLHPATVEIIEAEEERRKQISEVGRVVDTR